jgi:hypothetical protein
MGKKEAELKAPPAWVGKGYCQGNQNTVSDAYFHQQVTLETEDGL